LGCANICYRPGGICDDGLFEPDGHAPGLGYGAVYVPRAIDCTIMEKSARGVREGQARKKRLGSGDDHRNRPQSWPPREIASNAAAETYPINKS